MLRSTIPASPFHIVLLLVALFNALAGAPLHEARHIQELVRSATASATAGDVDAYAATSSTASDEHSARIAAERSAKRVMALSLYSCRLYGLAAHLARIGACGQAFPETPRAVRKCLQRLCSGRSLKCDQ